MRDQLTPSSPRFEWWRFGTMAILLGLIFIGIVALPRRHPTDFSIILAMAGFGASLIGFFAYRWHQLRVEVRESRFLIDEYLRNPQVYIRGSIVVFAVWFVCTLTLTIGIVVYSALHR
jgi:hypothetical protein